MALITQISGFFNPDWYSKSQNQHLLYYQFIIFLQQKRICWLNKTETGVWTPNWRHWQNRCRHVFPGKASFTKIMNKEDYQQLLVVWVVTKKQTAVGDQEGMCQLGKSAYSSKSETLPEQCVYVNTRLRSKLLRCDMVKCSLCPRSSPACPWMQDSFHC